MKINFYRTIYDSEDAPLNGREEGDLAYVFYSFDSRFDDDFIDVVMDYDRDAHSDLACRKSEAHEFTIETNEEWQMYEVMDAINYASYFLFKECAEFRMY